MAKDYAALERTTMRRSDREMTDDGWIRALLHRAPLGMLATVHDGQPFINSNLFVYDETASVIYTHTARVGRTRANIAAEDRVCFSVSAMGRLLPADTALEFSVEYAGVTVFGTASVVEGPESAHGLQLLLDKYAPHLRPDRDYRRIQPEELARTATYRIAIEAWTGKRKVAPDDAPGAFLYDEPDMFFWRT